MHPENTVYDLSIIIPAHNTSKFIPDLLKSLKEQKTEYNIEYIFVFDSCTDYTKNIVAESGIADILYSCEVHSCGLARNKGLDFARGKYIWFIDSDDYLLDENAIQDVITFIKDKNAPMIKLPFLSDNYHEQCSSMVWQYIFRRDFIADTRFRKEQPAEDGDFMEKIFKKYKEDWIDIFYYHVYFYRYLREGSNIFRYLKGEDINK